MLYAPFHLSTLTELVSEPDECHCQLIVISDFLSEYGFVVAICFTYLALHPVALYGSLEVPLRHAYQYQHGFFAFFTTFLHIHNPQWKGRDGAAVAFAEELFYQFLADDALFLAESGRRETRHYI